MTDREKYIATAFTGVAFFDGSKIHEFYDFLDKELDIPCCDISLTNDKIWERIKTKVTPLFAKIVEN